MSGRAGRSAASGLRPARSASRSAASSATCAPRAASDARADARGLPRDGHVPGYSGYIRGSQHYYGSSYTEVTRQASAVPTPITVASQGSTIGS